MIGGAGDIDFGLSSDDEDPPETLPTPGSAHLVIEDKCDALFFSAEWSILATVGKHVLAKSTPRGSTHMGPFIKRWTRQVIRSNKARLRRLGVDVEATYLSWGGVLEDLDD